MLIAFLLAWTPYAILVFLLSFSQHITLTWADSAALLGKSSTFYNPIIYALLYKRFRLAVAALFGIRATRVGIYDGSGTE